ncbi:MAG TPA: MBL fold metallo-hydrolase [Actinophytocola sp.]|uniref:MBL fold metallo-hydrolase n=1 Tax=Actinophytocola sp. TaxID=1872138 RepID=UPI002DBC91DD|nr:MBL fold metallo-hydrolase [Actinophytocola sp.]HEU5472401.1 MBL fold metallo-hydrolase [Actinophytocola sp.]
MRLRVLGSTGGWPGPGRACSGYLLEAAGRKVLVDAGSGVLVELLRLATPAELDAVWISHLHPDHCADLPMLWHTLAYGTPRDRPLPVLGPTGWSAALAPMLDEPERLGRIFTVVELTDGARHDFGPLTLRAVAMRHSLPTYGLRASCAGAILGYTADSAPCPAVTRLAEDADLFLCEAFLSTPGPPRFTSVSRPEDAGRAATLGGARRLVLTHLHPDADPGAAITRARTEFAGPVEVAEPGRDFLISG